MKEHEGKRLEKLLKFLEETPSDPFLLYAIALEYSTDEPEKAEEYFDSLLHEHPNYLPAYYHAAHQYLKAGQLEKVTAAFEKGITLAREQNETKTLAELQNAYMNFQIDGNL